MRTVARLVASVGLAVFVIVAWQAPVFAATAIEYGLIAA